MKNFIIAIITHQRKESLGELLAEINSQATDKIDCVVVENGSRALSSKSFSRFDNLKIKYFNLSLSSIPQARNKALAYAQKNNYLWLAFIDDDCLLDENWLAKIKKLTSKKQTSLAAIQGSSTGIPADNLYVELATKLHDLWLTKNTDKQKKTTVLDTRNCLLDLKKLPKMLRFNERLSYATDLELAWQLTEQQLSIEYQPGLKVFHREKINWLSFYRHRLRTSGAYLLVEQQISNNKIENPTISEKLETISQLKASVWEKLWLTILLGMIYFHSRILLLFHQLKTLHGTILPQESGA